MINMGKTSKLAPEEVISRAVEYFGPTGVGLDVKSQSDCCAEFEAMGGFVTVEVSNANGNGTEVSVMGREFEFQIQQFLGKI